MNIGEVEGIKVVLSPEAYAEVKKQKIIEENKILKEQQEEISKLNNIINELEMWAYELEGKILCNDSLCIKVEDFLDKLKELKNLQKQLNSVIFILSDNSDL